MPHSEAQAWWADVQHVRETIERRRAGLADSPAPRDAGTETRFGRHADTPLDDLDWAQVSATRAGDRADRTGRALHGDVASARARRPGADGAERGTARTRRDVDHLDLESDARRERARGSRRHLAEPDGERDPGRGRARASRRHLAELDTERDTGRERARASRRAPADPDAAAHDEGQTAPARTRRTHDGIAAPLAPPSSRRTVEITGRTVAAPPLPRLVEVERRRPPRRTVERVGPRPDRVALWAVLLCFFLILVAATSSRAATPGVSGHAGATTALHAAAR